jgi:hypothetical protein
MNFYQKVQAWFVRQPVKVYCTRFDREGPKNIDTQIKLLLFTYRMLMFPVTTHMFVQILTRIDRVIEFDCRELPLFVVVDWLIQFSKCYRDEKERKPYACPDIFEHRTWKCWSYTNLLGKFRRQTVMNYANNYFIFKQKLTPVFTRRKTINYHKNTAKFNTSKIQTRAKEV